jgi:hypothetical protein
MSDATSETHRASPGVLSRRTNQSTGQPSGPKSIKWLIALLDNENAETVVG